MVLEYLKGFMVTEDQLTVKAVLLQKWVTVHLNTQTCTGKQIVEIFFICFLFISHLLLLWAQKTFTPSYYYFSLAEIKDPIRGECPEAPR